MSRKMILKITADILMTAALTLLMCYSLVGKFAHEIIGIILFALFMAKAWFCMHKQDILSHYF